jgi:hypothetical protein
VPPALKLVSRGTDSSPTEQRSRWPLAFGLVLVAAALLATVAGADRTRRAVPARQIAQQALERALELGHGNAGVRLALTDLRRRLGRQPLDSRARVAYAGLLLGLSQRVEDTRAAAFHAALAADLAPVTVPVVRASTMILVRAGETDDALARVREMFLYDPRAAAETLLSRFPSAAVERGLAETPEAWLAWIDRLRVAGRNDEADAWLARAIRRWPRHAPTLERAAAMLIRQQSWQDLIELFDPVHEVPTGPNAARILAYRARARARSGDADAARDDVEAALRLNGADPGVQISAGDAYEAMGEHDLARQVWNRARYTLSADSPALTRVLLRLARLEDRHGRPTAALRLWRAILEREPEHPEARRRIAELTGTRR